MSLIVATWAGAIATALLAVGAGFTVYYARKEFREQSREVALLQKQVESEQEQRRREAEEQRRAQAARVYVTTEIVRDDHEAGYPAGPPSMAAGRQVDRKSRAWQWLGRHLIEQPSAAGC